MLRKTELKVKFQMRSYQNTLLNLSKLFSRITKMIDLGPSPDLDNLPSEAKNVLEDLNLSSSDSEDEKPLSKNQKRKGDPKTLKKKKSTQPSRQHAELILPAERVRHYDTDNVRKYMAKQKADRRRKLQEEKKERKLAQEHKQDQLRELSKKQKESIRMSQRNKDIANSQLGETFSKGPSGQVGVHLNGFDQVPRHHSYRQDGKKVCEDNIIYINETRYFTMGTCLILIGNPILYKKIQNLFN